MDGCIGVFEVVKFHTKRHRAITDADRLSDIFSVLAEPFEVFRKMDAEDLRDE